MAPLVLVVGVVGLFVFFPNLQRREIELRHHLGSVRCVERVAVEVRQDDVLLRRQKLSAAVELRQEMKLAEGEYRATARLECKDGEVIEAATRRIIVNADGVIHFNLDGRTCCEETRVR